MAEEQEWQIIITASAERAYFEVLDYVFKYHPHNQAHKVATELIEYPNTLKLNLT